MKATLRGRVLDYTMLIHSTRNAKTRYNVPKSCACAILVLTVLFTTAEAASAKKYSEGVGGLACEPETWIKIISEVEHLPLEIRTLYKVFCPQLFDGGPTEAQLKEFKETHVRLQPWNDKTKQFILEKMKCMSGMFQEVVHGFTAGTKYKLQDIKNMAELKIGHRNANGRAVYGSIGKHNRETVRKYSEGTKECSNEYNFIIAASDLSFTKKGKTESWLLVGPTSQDADEIDEYCPIIPLVYFKTTPDEFQRCFPKIWRGLKVKIQGIKGLHGGGIVMRQSKRLNRDDSYHWDVMVNREKQPRRLPQKNLKPAEKKEGSEASTFYDILGFPNSYEPFRIYDANTNSNENKSPFTFYGNILDDRNVRAIYQKDKWENATVIPGWSQASPDVSHQSLGGHPLGEPSKANSEALNTPSTFGYNPEAESTTAGCWWCWCGPDPAKQENLENRKVINITQTEVKYTEHEGKNVSMIKLTLDPEECTSNKIRQEIFVDMAHYGVKQDKAILRFTSKDSFTDLWFRIAYLQFDTESAAKAFKKILKNPSS